MNNTNNADAALDPDTYLQHAQIIQGVLIFLSACVAVVGYAVQARLQALRTKLEAETQGRHAGGGAGTQTRASRAARRRGHQRRAQHPWAEAPRPPSGGL